MKKKFLLSACLALSLVLAGCNSAGGNSTIKGSGSVEGVRLTQDTFNVDIGETYFLKSFVEFTPTYPADQTYTLETSDETIFTVDSNQGSFTGVSIGIGTLTLTTTDGGYTASATVIVGGGIKEEEPDDEGDPEITYENYTIVFTLYDSNLNVQTTPEYGSLYIAGDYDGTWNSSGWWDWGNLTQLTETTDEAGNIAYSLHLDSVFGGSHEYNIYFTYTGDEPGWNAIRAEKTTFTIATTAASGDTQYVKVLDCYDIEDQYPPKGGDVNFYILFVDSDGSANTSTLSGYSLQMKSSDNSDYFQQNGDSSWHNYSSVTIATTGSSSKACIYNSGYATAPSGTSDYFYIYSSGNLDISTGSITIPANTTGYAVYTLELDLSSNSKQDMNGTGGTWYTSVSDITSFITTL